MNQKYFNSDPDRLKQFSKDSVYQGRPDFSYIANDTQEIQEVIRDCSSRKLPVTFCGSQTSMTGSSVAEEGVSLSLGKRNKILEIGVDSKSDSPFVITEPGVILSDLKDAVREQGYFYPPDPTSFHEAQIGSTVATNATGEDTYKYGPTRRYVDELEVITAEGVIKTLSRQDDMPHTLFKNTAGYYLKGNEIDEVIGSEGTLALITKVKLRLLPALGKNVFLLILPFSSFENCLQAVTVITKKEAGPRALELIGPGATEYFQKCSACPEVLKQEKSFLYIKEEYADESSYTKKLSEWTAYLEKLYSDVDDRQCFERVFIAKTDAQLDSIRTCRHYIPTKVNEDYFYDQKEGGKVGTDWWVPIQHLQEMMMKTYQEAVSLEIPFLVFAHIGNGHPHWNFLTRSAEEKQLAIEFVKRQCQMAVSLGGGVAGEHGIGKIKRYLMNIQHSPKVMQQMIALKNKWDPNWLFGRNNILDYPS